MQEDKEKGFGAIDFDKFQKNKRIRQGKPEIVFLSPDLNEASK